MSTRSTTHFTGSGGRIVAKVYRHADGYPEGHGRDLHRFFEDVEAQTNDTRFTDPSYLAAKLVVWLAREFATTFRFEGTEFVHESHANERPLDFLSVGIVIEDPSDVEYVYEVDTANLIEGRPTVRAYEVDHSNEWDAPVRKGKQVEIPAAEAGES